MKPFRAAIVGAGGIAKNHIVALYHEGGRVEVVGAVWWLPYTSVLILLTRNGFETRFFEWKPQSGSSSTSVQRSPG